MTVIKAADNSRAVRRSSFNFDDMAAQAQTYLDQVRIEANKIVAEARQEAKSLRKQAEQQGRQDAQKSVQQLVDQQVGRQMETVLPALRDAIAQLQHAKQAWQIHWEGRAVHLAAAMAGRVIRREVDRQPQIALPLVREALSLAAGSAHVRLRMNPEDHQALAGQVEKLVAEFSRVGTAEVLPDPAIARGGCRLESKHGVIDQQFEAQLARIEEELT